MRARRIACLAVLGAALAPMPAVADIVRHTAIPAVLQDRWAPTAEECGSEKSVVTLSATRYTGADLDCKVDWVNETAGASGPIYSVHATCAGADGKRPTTATMILVPKAREQMLVGSAFDSLKPYQRCPAAGPKPDNLGH